MLRDHPARRDDGYRSEITASSPRCAFSLLQTKVEEDPFYTGCSTTKNCFGAPAGCVKSKDCVAAVAVIVQGDQYLFELQAQGKARYVAVGLSDDKNMVIARRAEVSRPGFLPGTAARAGAI